MNLWLIQPFAADLLRAAPTLAGVPVLTDDGSYPKTPQREEALRTKGLVLIVWQIESDGLIDTSFTGLAAHEIYVPIVIEENVKANRSETGTRIEAEKALQYVLAALCGKPAGGPPKQNFVAMDPPFKNFGKVNGVNRIVANLSIRAHIQPT